MIHRDMTSVIDSALARAEHREALLDRTLECLRRLVKQLERVQGYATHEQQAELREARAVIVESEGKCAP